MKDVYRHNNLEVYQNKNELQITSEFLANKQIEDVKAILIKESIKC